MHSMHGKNKEAAKPELLYMDRKEDIAQFQKLIKEKEIKLIDCYEGLIREFFVIKNPYLKSSPDQEKLFKSFLEKYVQKNKDLRHCGVWIFYPWNNELVHCLPEDEYYTVRTARNRNLVTAEEQDKLRNFRVGIIGLSVGQASVMTLAISGMCDYMKLADPDLIEASNLNRIQAGISSIGLKKTDYAARKIFELNPFAKISLYQNQITDDNLENFLLDDYKLNAVVDAFDDVRMKVRLRIVARKNKIPVLMATDLGDGTIVDIERYDIDDNLPIFHGRIAEEEMQDLPREMKYEEVAKIATKMIGPENIPPRMIDSLKLVGKELAGHPQLALASFLGGAITAYTIKQIALGKKLSSERLYIQFDKLL